MDESLIKSGLNNPDFFRFHLFDSIDSTNNFLLDLGKQDQPGWSVVAADVQTAGKGRLNRHWESPRDKGLLFSILLRPQVEPSFSNLINLLSAACLADFLEEEIISQTNQKIKVDLKWPNDLLIKGKKVAGILLQSNLIAGELQFVVVGIGLNVNHDIADFSGDIKKTATSFKIETHLFWIREKILAGFLNQFYASYEKYFPTGGEEILKLYLNKVIHLGEKVKVNQVGNEISGVFNGLSPEGYMLLKQNDEIKIISNGEIVS